MMDHPIPGPGEPKVLPLWPEGVPGAAGEPGLAEEEVTFPGGLQVVRNVTRPTLTAFLPDPAIANGTAVIVCPGGAWHFLSIDMEGRDVAREIGAELRQVVTVSGHGVSPGHLAAPADGSLVLKAACGAGTDTSRIRSMSSTRSDAPS